MSFKMLLRLISLIMFLIAIIFISFALNHPEFGTTFYIGNFKIGADIWRIFYIIYILIMIGLFAFSYKKK